MYCENCNRIVEEERCPVCGSKKIRNPEAKDPCFVTETDFIHTGILEDVLKQNGIPFLKKNMLGAGTTMRVGPLLERTKFYVPFERLPEAAEIAEVLFSETDEDAALVTE